MSEEYNGWTNRETWCMNLWITNEQGWDEQMRELAKHMSEDVVDDAGELLSQKLNDPRHHSIKNGLGRARLYTLSQEIEAFFEEEFSWEYVKDNENLYNVVKDVGSLYRVNWIEIAEHFIDDAEAGNDD